MPKVKHRLKKLKKSTLTFLDKLEVTSELLPTQSAKTLYNTALSRYNTIKKLNRIIEDNPIEAIYNKYAPAFNCSKVVLQEGNSLSIMRCKKKFCQTCSRIKTADMINGYSNSLEELGKLYMITLTAPTVEGRQLKSEIRKRLKAFQRVKDRLRKQGVKLQGMRKTECTYSKGKFHPHFHMMQKGKKEAELLKTEWLKEFPSANDKAQDITEVNGIGSFKELFKYNVKEVIKNEDIPAKALHTIYKAFEGIRNFQPYGKVRKAKRTKNEDEIEQGLTTDFMPINEQYQYEIYLYKYSDKTWLNASNKKLIKTKYISFQLSKQEDRANKPILTKHKEQRT